MLGAMNVFTKSLLALLGLGQNDLQEFVRRWDVLEQLVISVFRAKAAAQADEVVYAETRVWLNQHYPQWRDALQPHWQRAKVAGQLASTDPFALLLAHQQAADFVKNWAAMQNLPAAREALNNLILEATTRE
jgi:hypothetical protein